MGLVLYSDDGFFVPSTIAEAFRTTSEEVARTAGLGRDAVQRKDRVRSDKTQRRLREMVEVDAGPSGNVEDAIVRKMIEIIRKHQPAREMVSLADYRLR